MALITSVEELSSYINSEQSEKQYQGLSLFVKEIKANKALPGDEPCQLLVDYLAGSPQCSEIFALLTSASKNYRLISKAATLIAFIISPSTRGTDRTVAMAVARKVMRKHLKVLYWLLSAEDNRVICSALEVLLAMVQLGAKSSLARELQAKFNFSLKPFMRLPYKPFAKSEKHPEQAKKVRSLFIRFSLAFLENGDAELTKATLEINNFVTSMLKDLVRDDPEDVAFVLTTLRTCIFEHSAVPSHVRTAFLNRYVLDQVLNLYDASQTHSELAHAFMLRLLEITRASINATSWSAWKHQRQTYLHLLSRLRANEHPRQQLLAVSILSSFPQLTIPYLKTLAFSFEPRPSFRWLANVNLLLRVHALAVHPMARASPRAVLGQMFPQSFPKDMFSKGLKHASPLVRHASLQLLLSCFRRFSAVCQHASDPASVVEAGAALRVYLPDMQVVFGLRKELESGDTSDARTAKLQALLLDVMCAYQTQFPGMLLEARVDVWRFVPPHADRLPALCLLRLVNLLRAAGPSNTRVWSRQKLADDAVGQTPTNFGRLLRVLAALEPGAVHDALQVFLTEILRVCVAMGEPGTPLLEAELSAWLACVTPASAAYLETLVYNAAHAELQGSTMSDGESACSPLLLTALGALAEGEEVATATAELLFRVSARMLHLCSPSLLSASGLRLQLQRLVGTGINKKRKQPDSSTGSAFAPLLKGLSCLAENMATSSMFELGPFAKALKHQSKVTTAEAKARLSETGDAARVFAVLDELSPQLLNELLPHLAQTIAQPVLVDFLSTYCATPLLDLPSVRTMLLESDVGVSTDHQALHQLLVALPDPVLFTHALAADFEALSLPAVRAMLMDGKRKGELSPALLQRLGEAMLDFAKKQPGATVSAKVLTQCDFACQCLDSLLVFVGDVIEHTQSPAAEKSLLSFLASFLESTLLVGRESPVSTLVVTSVATSVGALLARNVPGLRDIVNPFLERLVRDAAACGAELEAGRYPRPLTLLRIFMLHVPDAHLRDVARALLAPASEESRTGAAAVLAQHYPFARHVLAHWEHSAQVISELLVTAPGDSTLRLETLLQQLLAGTSAASVHKETVSTCLKRLSQQRGLILAQLLRGPLATAVADQFAEHALRCWDSGLQGAELRWMYPAWVAYFQSPLLQMAKQALPTKHLAVVLKLRDALTNERRVEWEADLLREDVTDGEQEEACVELLRLMRVWMEEGHMSQLLESALQTKTALKTVLLSSKRFRLCQVLLPGAGEGGVAAFLSKAIRALSELFKKDTSPLERELCTHLLPLVESITDVASLSGVPDLAKNMSRFLANAVRYRADEPETLRLLAAVIRRCQLPDALPPVHVYDILVSNATFVGAVLYPASLASAEVAISSPTDVGYMRKLQLLDLLLALLECKKDGPALEPTATDNLRRLLLASYDAGAGPGDLALLRVLRVLEANGSAVCGADVRWGAAGLADLRSRMNEDEEKATHTVDSAGDAGAWVFSNFSWRRLSRGPPMNETEEEQRDRYDAGFVLPFLTSFVKEAQVDVRRMVQVNMASYSVLGMAADSLEVRKLAYAFVSLFSELVDAGVESVEDAERTRLAETFQEAPQVQVLLNLLKNAITSKFERLPGIPAAFIGRCLPLMLQAQHFLYKGLCRFALQRPALDLQDIPAFYQLLHSSNPDHHRAERTWMLWTLENGFAHPEDFALMERRFAFGLLLSLHDSEAADNVTRDVVLKVIVKVCANPSHLVSLTENHGLLVWFTAGIGNSRMTIHALRKVVGTLRSASASLLRSGSILKEHTSKDKILLELVNVAMALLFRLHSLLAHAAAASPTVTAVSLAASVLPARDDSKLDGDGDKERPQELEESLESLMLETAHSLVMFVTRGAEEGSWKMPCLPSVPAPLVVSLLGWCATANKAAMATSSVQALDLLSLFLCKSESHVAYIISQSLSALEAAIGHYAPDSVAATPDAASTNLSLLSTWAHWVLRLVSSKDDASKALRQSLHEPETLRRLTSLFALLQRISSAHSGYLEALVAVNSLFLALRVDKHGEEDLTAVAVRILPAPDTERGRRQPTDESARCNLRLSMFFTAHSFEEPSTSSLAALLTTSPDARAVKKTSATPLKVEKSKKRKTPKK